MFDFPNSPTNGQQFTPVVGGPTYVWQSPIWRLAAGGINAGVYIGDTAPINPVAGMLWWESDSGNTFIYYDDGSSAQWIQFNIAPPIPPAPSPFKRSSIATLGTTTSFQFDVSTLFADIEVVGGGGGGGGSGTGSGAGVASAASGGGGAGYCKKLIEVTAAVRAATKTIFVGGGGSGSTTVGVNGGISSYTDGVNTLTANGGVAGTQGAFATQVGVRAGGAQGSATGGDINISGQPGAPGFGFGNVPTGAAGQAAAAGGNGGASAIGSGGVAPAYFSTLTATGANGGNGSTGGGGAGAAAVNAVGSATAGGNGGNGFVLITEYR